MGGSSGSVTQYYLFHIIYINTRLARTRISCGVRCIIYLSIVPTTTKSIHITRTSCTLLENYMVTKLRNFKTNVMIIEVIDHLIIFLTYESYFNTVQFTPKEIEYKFNIIFKLSKFD